MAGRADNPLQPGYSRASLQPVVATRTSDATINIDFNEPFESLYYAAGTSYEMDGDVMRIAIDRCPIKGHCRTMLRRHVEPGAGHQAAQEVPLLAPKVVMVFADGEEQIYP